MIKIISHFAVKEDCLQAALDVIEDVIQKTRSSDSGWTEYDLYQDSQHPAQLVILETWQSQADLDAHSLKEHTKHMGERLSPLMNTMSFGFYQKIM